MPLAYHFGIRPWEVELLTVDEFNAFCTAIDNMGEGAGT